jgi:hypothetical protein
MEIFIRALNKVWQIPCQMPFFPAGALRIGGKCTLEMSQICGGYLINMHADIQYAAH